MKKMVWVMMFLLAIGVAGCNVTETGNPCPAGDCMSPDITPNPSISGESSYRNETFGVSITPPALWTFEELGDDRVRFESGGLEPQTTAIVSFVTLDPIPDALLLYLDDAYPERTFLNYSTPSLTGYLYDDPVKGPSDGDLREYFFLEEALLITVSAEVQTATRLEFKSLLEAIQVQ